MVRMVSLNIGGNSSTYGGIDRYLRGLDSGDVLAVQEVKVREEVWVDLLESRGYVGRVSLDPVSGLGVALAWRREFELKRYHVIEEGKAQLLDLGFGAIVNIYGPAGKGRAKARRVFFGETVFHCLARERQVWMLGDFNCITGRLDSSGNWKDKYCPVLKDLVGTLGLVDGYRSLDLQGREYTWVRAGFASSRLDRVYVSDTSVGALLSVVHRASLSDHKAVVLSVNLAGLPSPAASGGGSPYWKLNVNCLKEGDCVEGLRELFRWLELEKEGYGDVAVWWDRLCKVEIRRFLMRYGARRAKERRDTVRFLYAVLEAAVREGDFLEAGRVKELLKEFALEDAWGIAVRSRVSSEVEDEVAGLFHLNREKKNAERCSLSSLKIGGEVVTDRDRVEKEVFGFFKPLFEGRHVSGGQVGVEEFKQDDSLLGFFLDGLPRLSEDARNSLERKVTVEEVEAVLGDLPDGKSSGTDGLPYEFYKEMRSHVSPVLVGVFNTVLERFRLTVSMETGAVRLVPKVDTVPSVDQLRPITLLQCDYKILTKILTVRLVSVLGEVLLSGQLIGKEKGGENIVCGAVNLVQAVVFAQETGAECGLFSVDWWKAFDRVFIPYLLQVMGAMGFGAVFMDWVRMLHTGNKACFILDELTESIDILFSVRQGDPIAMILFIIFLEPLLRKIVELVPGVWVGGARLTHEPYADDISGLFKAGDLERLEAVMTQYERVSGALVNRTKCKALGLGGWAGRMDFGVRLFEGKEEVKVLGVRFVPDMERLVRINWEGVVEKVKKCLAGWRSRVLPTLVLRKHALQTFALSKLWYLSQILHLPDWALEAVEAAMGSFLWLGSAERVSLETLMLEERRGGIGLVNTRVKADALFLRTWARLFSLYGTRYYEVAAYWLGFRLRKFLPWLRRQVHGFIHSPLHDAAKALVVRVVVPEEGQQVEGQVFSARVFLGQSSRSLGKALAPVLPAPTVEEKRLGLQVEWGVVWRRLLLQVLDPKVRDLMFRLIHNVHPTKQRLEHINCAWDNVCPAEGTGVPRQGPVKRGRKSLSKVFVDGPVQDRVHLFCECRRVVSCWTWLRNVVVWELLPVGVFVTDEELILLAFPRVEKARTVTWLVGVYVDWLWGQYRRRGGEVPVREMVLFLKAQYRRMRVRLDCVPSLEQ